MQVPCASLAVEGAAQHGRRDAWAACLDPEYGLSRRIQSKRCRVYSFGCVHQRHKPMEDEMSSTCHAAEQHSKTFLLFIWSSNPPGSGKLVYELLLAGPPSFLTLSESRLAGFVA